MGEAGFGGGTAGVGGCGCSEGRWAGGAVFERCGGEGDGGGDGVGEDIVPLV